MKPIGQILLEHGRITGSQLAEALSQKAKTHELIGQIFVKLGVKPDDLLSALAEQRGIEWVDVSAVEISGEALAMVPLALSESFDIMPVSFDGATETLTVAVADPDKANEAELHFIIPGAKNFKIAWTSPEYLLEARKKYYRTDLDAFGKGEAPGAVVDTRHEIEEMSADKLRQAAADAPIVNLVNMVLLQAVKDRASDIHFESYEDDFRIRYRIDGVLYELQHPSIKIAPAVMSRVKVMTGKMDIAERRVPQDARIELIIAGHPVDLRVSTLPIAPNGEKIVMRVLDRRQLGLSLEDLGFRGAELAVYKRLVNRPNGIILVTGPTGSGKTTTLYATLKEQNEPGVAILTVEDPVEYYIEGISQTPVNPDIGVTFDRVLRQFLRHDPDIILVGEIRDLETAEIAVESALTGHIVFSTVHTNDAASAITRLIDLGLEPFKISATVGGIIAQRLVRKICVKCKQEYEPKDEELLELGLTREAIGDRTFFYGKGCSECKGSGYKGRVAIYEILEITSRITGLILDRVPSEDIRKVALEEGMGTLRQAGLQDIYDGVTTIEEVMRETLVTI